MVKNSEVVCKKNIVFFGGQFTKLAFLYYIIQAQVFIIIKKCITQEENLTLAPSVSEYMDADQARERFCDSATVAFLLLISF